MPFDIKAFFLTNRVIFIWLALFGMLYVIVIQGLFGLFFITFFMSFIVKNLVKRIRRRHRLPTRLLILGIYLAFITAFLVLLSLVVPKLGVEATNFVRQLPQGWIKLQAYLDRLAADQPTFAQVIQKVKSTLSLSHLVGVDFEGMGRVTIQFFNQITHYVSNVLVGTLFSFLILWDYPNLKRKVRSLRRTRLREAYATTAGSIVALGRVVGAAFQAQILIAGANTILTTIGLYFLGIEPIILLAIIVFLCGLIPALGTFISSVPIILLGVNVGGFKTGSLALLMILFVHVMENYLINPRVFCHVFKLSPILVLIILYVSYNVVGVWGLLLGVPVSVFIHRHLIMGAPAASCRPYALLPEEPCGLGPDLEDAPGEDPFDE